MDESERDGLCSGLIGGLRCSTMSGEAAGEPELESISAGARGSKIG